MSIGKLVSFAEFLENAGELISAINVRAWYPNVAATPEDEWYPMTLNMELHSGSAFYVGCHSPEGLFIRQGQPPMELLRDDGKLVLKEIRAARSQPLKLIEKIPDGLRLIMEDLQLNVLNQGDELYIYVLPVGQERPQSVKEYFERIDG